MNAMSVYIPAIAKSRTICMTEPSMKPSVWATDLHRR
jgi:hypothetical protein